MKGFKTISKKQTGLLPKTSGVYLLKFKNQNLYIGKAINIRDRVKNHFNQPSYRDNLFIEKVKKIGYFETGSEIEALILEANLIKKYQPKFNVIWKDDKNYFYVTVTKDKCPVIYISHRKNADAEYIGPFVEGTALKKTLRFLRRAFPYYTLRSGSGQAFKHPKIKCTYCHLDLCPGPNPDLKEYKKNIKKLILILRGKRSAVLNGLKKEMKLLSKEKKFEEAGEIRDRIFALQQVMSHTKVIEDNAAKTSAMLNVDEVLAKIIGAEKSASKIECYDISNIQGKQATGSMVVFVDGKPDKNLYRKFKIKMKNEPNDIAMLKETLERRFSHPEWKFPEIILIDGGKTQLNIAIKIKSQKANTKHIKVISIAKKNKELFIEGRNKPVLLKTLPREIYNLILQLDDEAHRFAITYHKRLRERRLLG